MIAHLTVSTLDTRQGGLFTTDTRHETPHGQTPTAVRASLLSTLRTLHGRRVPHLHSASLSATDGQIWATLTRDAQGWVLTAHAPRCRATTERL